MNETNEPLDVLEELVEERYPKGTTDPYGRALRHQLHKLGRLNEPDYGLVLQRQLDLLMRAKGNARGSSYELKRLTEELAYVMYDCTSAQLWRGVDDAGWNGVSPTGDRHDIPNLRKKLSR